MTKVKTTTIGGGAQYAKVSERLKAFRTENPRASIVTTPIPQEGGMMMFKTFIIKDKADEFSADATGHALQVKAGQKDFEKLETISVGRALALLGYSADGEVATGEEMEEYYEYQESKKQEAIQCAIDKLDDCKTQDELKECWSSLGSVIQEKKVEDYKNKLKTTLK